MKYGGYVAICVVAFVCGCLLGAFVVPLAKVTVASHGEIVTNTITRYKYVTVDNVNPCAEYASRYNDLLSDYRAYASCAPYNVRSVDNGIYFELSNADLTNTYRLSYTEARAKIFSLHLGGFVAFPFSGLESVGLAASVGIGAITIDGTARIGAYSIGAKYKIAEF